MYEYDIIWTNELEHFGIVRLFIFLGKGKAAMEKVKKPFVKSILIVLVFILSCMYSAGRCSLADEESDRENWPYLTIEPVNGYTHDGHEIFFKAMIAGGTAPYTIECIIQEQLIDDSVSPVSRVYGADDYRVAECDGSEYLFSYIPADPSMNISIYCGGYDADGYEIEGIDIIIESTVRTGSDSAPARVAIDKDHFPDDNFRKYVKKFDKDKSGDLDTAEISGITSVNVDAKEIKTLQGIQYFAALKELYCSGNFLTSLDVRNNTNLVYLECIGNQLTSLDPGGNTNLKDIFCGRNQLQNLDVSGAVNLESLICENNQLTSLDLSRNEKLEVLTCFNNQLVSLNPGGSKALRAVSCQNNQLASLSPVRNAGLKELKCYNNQLTVLDISGNAKLESLSCYDNKLSSLDVSSNINLEFLYCENNQLSTLDISRNTRLQSVYCFNNQLNSLDISRNTGLKNLRCNDNHLASLNVDRNTGLKELDCSNNQLETLNISENTLLDFLSCYGNRITFLDVSSSDALCGYVNENTRKYEDMYHFSYWRLYVDNHEYWKAVNVTNELMVDPNVTVKTDTSTSYGNSTEAVPDDPYEEVAVNCYDYFPWIGAYEEWIKGKSFIYDDSGRSRVNDYYMNPVTRENIFSLDAWRPLLVSLYDFDWDGIPELLIDVGGDFNLGNIDVYAWNDSKEKVTYIGSISYHEMANIVYYPSAKYTGLIAASGNQGVTEFVYYHKSAMSLRGDSVGRIEYVDPDDFMESLDEPIYVRETEDIDLYNVAAWSENSIPFTFFDLKETVNSNWVTDFVKPALENQMVSLAGQYVNKDSVKGYKHTTTLPSNWEWIQQMLDLAQFNFSGMDVYTAKHELYFDSALKACGTTSQSTFMIPEKLNDLQDALTNLKKFGDFNETFFLNQLEKLVPEYERRFLGTNEYNLKKLVHDYIDGEISEQGLSSQLIQLGLVNPVTQQGPLFQNMHNLKLLRYASKGLKVFGAAKKIAASAIDLVNKANMLENLDQEQLRYIADDYRGRGTTEMKNVGKRLIAYLDASDEERINMLIAGELKSFGIDKLYDLAKDEIMKYAGGITGAAATIVYMTIDRITGVGELTGCNTQILAAAQNMEYFFLNVKNRWEFYLLYQDDNSIKNLVFSFLTYYSSAISTNEKYQNLVKTGDEAILKDIINNDAMRAAAEESKEDNKEYLAYMKQIRRLFDTWRFLEKYGSRSVSGPGKSGGAIRGGTAAKAADADLFVTATPSPAAESSGVPLSTPAAESVPEPTSVSVTEADINQDQSTSVPDVYQPVAGYQNVYQAKISGIEAPYIVGKSDPAAYAPEKMTDGQDSTSWQFSTKKNKLKKTYVVISFSEPADLSSLWIKNGSWRDDAKMNAYTANSRIKDMDVRFRYGDSEWKDKTAVRLSDDKTKADWQKIDLGEHTGVTAVQLCINSIYKGSKYSTDVCVTELMFIHEPGL